MSSRIIILFVLVVSLPSIQAQDLITTTCDQCIFKDLCKSTLGSSQAKDLNGLAKAAVQALTAHANEAQKRTDKSLTTADPASKPLLSTCSEIYKTVIPHLAEAIKALDAKRYDTATIRISAAIRNQRSCEHGFNIAELKSPLTDLDTKFTQLGSMSLTITSIAQKSQA